MKGGTYLAEEQTVLFGYSINQLGLALGELRRVTHNLVPATLLESGLLPALENLCNGLKHSGIIQVHLQHFNFVRRLTREQETVAYHMVQQAVNNVLKHAEARQIIIQLRKVENQVQIEIEDDGKGFNPSKVAIAKTGGLQNLKNQTEYLKGNLTIVSEPGKGTSLYIEFPLGLIYEYDAKFR